MKLLRPQPHAVALPLLGAALLFLAPPTQAIPVDANINGAVVQIGNISASNGFYRNDPATSKLEESGSFTLDAAYKYLMDDAHGCEFRWFQIVTADSGPPKWMGAPPPTPYTDPPSNGWDYQRNPPNDFANGTPGDDTLPFYENNAEYAQDSRTSSLGHNQADGKSVTSDIPGLSKQANFNLQFKTFIVFFDPTLAANRQFVVLEGYSWGGSYGNPANAGTFAFNGPLAISPGDAAFDLAQMQTALNNDGFRGWTPLDGSRTPIACPEGGSALVILLLSFGCLASLRKQFSLG